MSYECKVLVDSVSFAGHRITTWQVTFPRIILAEVNTHCMFGRNSASSRAIPVKRRIASIEEDPFVPEVFGRNQRGMQPGAPLEGEGDQLSRLAWERHRQESISYARQLDELGVHKQYANRLLEPHAWHTAVITATDVDNFEHLRVNPAAQGEFQKLARMMIEARNASEPSRAADGYWHLPYVYGPAGQPVHPEDLEWALDKHRDKWLDALVKVSVMRCARVSYLNQDGSHDPEKDEGDFESKLLSPGHMSPLEHAARPMTELELELTKAYDVAYEIDGEVGPMLRVRGSDWAPMKGDYVTLGGSRTGKRARIASVRGPLHYSAKFNGWISRRAFVPGEWDILGFRNG